MLPGTTPSATETRPPAAALRAAAARFGTPLYVTDLAVVAAAAARLEAAFGHPWLRLYSVKANDLPALTAFLHQRGWGASVVSDGEWQYASAAGVANDSLAFEGIGKTDDQLAHAVAETAAGRPLRWLAIESGQEASVLAGLAEDAGLGRGGVPPLDVLLRLNPGVAPETRPGWAVGAPESKFGMSEQEILALAGSGTLAGPGLRLRGIQVHVGSDLGDVQAFADAGTRAARLLATLRATLQAAVRDCWLDTIDFGGGFPLPADDAPEPAAFHGALTAALRESGLRLPPRPAIEPGRYLAGAAGWLVARVLHARARAGHDQQVVLDAGMTEFMRPALYGSRHSAQVLAADDGGAALDRHDEDVTGGLMNTSLEGPVCEVTDSFGHYRLPPLQRGDLVTIGQAGAYGASFTSRYNGRPPPAEVLLWPDGSLQLGDRPRIRSAVRHTPPAPPPAEPAWPLARCP